MSSSVYLSQDLDQGHRDLKTGKNWNPEWVLNHGSSDMGSPSVPIDYSKLSFNNCYQENKRCEIIVKLNFGQIWSKNIRVKWYILRMGFFICAKPP